jgi:hypothetical protein
VGLAGLRGNKHTNSSRIRPYSTSKSIGLAPFPGNNNSKATLLCSPGFKRMRYHFGPQATQWMGVHASRCHAACIDTTAYTGHQDSQRGTAMYTRYICRHATTQHYARVEHSFALRGRRPASRLAVVVRGTERTTRMGTDWCKRTTGRCGRFRNSHFVRDQVHACAQFTRGIL